MYFKSFGIENFELVKSLILTNILHIFIVNRGSIGHEKSY